MPTSYVPGMHRWRVRCRPRSHTRRGMRSGTFFDFEDAPAEECLGEMKRSEPYQEFDIILKCFDILSATATEQSKDFEMHCGEHTEFTQQCLCSAKFQPLLDACHDRALELWQNKSDIKVVCCCTEGWYASVAMASILRAVFALKGYNAVGPCHLSLAPCWAPLCRHCPDCLPNAEKSEMLAVIADTWVPT